MIEKTYILTIKTNRLNICSDIIKRILLKTFPNLMEEVSVEEIDKISIDLTESPSGLVNASAL